MSNAMNAARLLARCGSDPEFRAEFIADPAGTAKAGGVDLHPHPNYDVLEDTATLRHIVVTEDKHGTAGDGDLPAHPTLSDIRRWVVFHVHAGDAVGTAIREDVGAAITAAGATAPAGMTFQVAVDDASTMHIALPPLADAEISLEQAEVFAGAGAESVDTNTTEAVEAETTEVTVTETTELQDTETTTTVAAEVELVVVPGFIS